MLLLFYSKLSSLLVLIETVPFTHVNVTALYTTASVQYLWVNRVFALLFIFTMRPARIHPGG